MTPPMKTLEITIPEEIAKELAYLVEKEWFDSESEIVRAALLEYLRRHHRDLQERFQMDDIAWALKQKKNAA